MSEISLVLRYAPSFDFWYFTEHQLVREYNIYGHTFHDVFYIHSITTTSSHSVAYSSIRSFSFTVTFCFQFHLFFQKERSFQISSINKILRMMFVCIFSPLGSIFAEKILAWTLMVGKLSLRIVETRGAFHLVKNSENSGSGLKWKTFFRFARPENSQKKWNYRDYLRSSSTFSGNFPVGRTKKTFSI